VKRELFRKAQPDGRSAVEWTAAVQAQVKSCVTSANHWRTSVASYATNRQTKKTNVIMLHNQQF